MLTSAGALSMAAGEYVSVSSQADTENADILREQQELLDDPEGELDILTQIYVERGLERDLARQVAVALTESEVRAPYISRVSRSRPNSSVPSQCAPEAG